MILKYFELNKINLDNNFILFHGKNPGLKKKKFKKLIINLNQK